jgi:hypothetical protein
MVHQTLMQALHSESEEMPGTVTMDQQASEQ